MMLTIFAAAVLASHPPVAAAPVPPDPSVVTADDPRATVDAFHAALRSGQGTKALALLADDVLVLESGHAEESKAEYEASHLAADMEYEAAVTATVDARRVAVENGVAWVASEGHSTGRFRGKDVNRMTAETMVLRRFADGWRIVHIHWSSAAGH